MDVRIWIQCCLEDDVIVNSAGILFSVCSPTSTRDICLDSPSYLCTPAVTPLDFEQRPLFTTITAECVASLVFDAVTVKV